MQTILNMPIKMILNLLIQICLMIKWKTLVIKSKQENTQVEEKRIMMMHSLRMKMNPKSLVHIWIQELSDTRILKAMKQF